MKRVLRVLGWIYLVYILLSVLVVIPLLNFLPPWFVEQQYQRKLSTELVVFNPFSLALEVRQARLSETDGSEFAGFDRAVLNLSTSGLWRPGWVLDEVALEGLNVHLQRLENGGLNIDDLLAPGPEQAPDPAPTNEEAGQIPGITIRDILFSAHRIRVTDRMRAEPYTTHWDELRLRASDLSTVSEADHPYHLRLFDESGGTLEWDGELSIPEGYSRGRIELSVIGLRPFWRFIKDQVDFELVEGRLHTVLDYELDWSGAFRFRVSDGQVDVTRLALAPAPGIDLPDTGIELSTVTVNGIAVDSEQQLAAIGSVHVNGFQLRGWMEAERISLAEMFQTRFPETESEEPEAPNSWRVALGEARVNGAVIQWRTPFTDPGTLAVNPLDIAVSGITWPVEAASDIQVDYRVNDRVTGSIEGSLHLESGEGTLDYALRELPVPWFAPNIPEILNARLDSGTVRAAGSVSLAGFAPRQLTMDGAVADFSMRLYDGEESLTSWKILEWDELAVDLPGQAVDLARLHLDQYSGRVHILEDGSLNIQRLLREEAEARAASEGATAPEDDTRNSGAESPWRFRLPEIAISDSAVDFMDESLPIHFRTVVGDINGEITGLDSDPARSLDVDLQGSVDGYAPVALKGTASPLREQPALDLGLTFQGVDLARLTPYSGTYAGYAIDRGTLNLAVQYSLEDNRLQGDNKVVIKQLKLGDKIESDKALDIPLQLGIALLTDINGVIDLAVPVSGDVDNPEFSLSSVIWGAFANLLTKAVTAPFRLLANLVGSDDNLQQVNFAAGSSALDAPAQQKLGELAQAMLKRPQLKLVITGRLNPDTDRAKLQQALLREALLAEGLSEADISERSESWEASIAARYAALAGAAESAEADAPPPSAVVQARRVAAQIEVPAAALKSLAEDRAASAKRFLVNEGGVPADNAVIEQTDVADEANSFSGVEMSLDT